MFRKDLLTEGGKSKFAGIVLQGYEKGSYTYTVITSFSFRAITLSTFSL